MVLSGPDIVKCIEEGRLGFNPPVPPTAVTQAAVDLKLGYQFCRFKDAPVGTVHELLNDALRWEAIEREALAVHPGDFLLAQTLEWVSLGPDLVGFLQGRSSWARCGLMVSLGADKIDAGFQGNIVLEIVNLGPATVLLRPGFDHAVQLMIARLSSALSSDQCYGARESDICQRQSVPLPILRHQGENNGPYKA